MVETKGTTETADGLTFWGERIVLDGFEVICDLFRDVFLGDCKNKRVN